MTFLAKLQTQLEDYNLLNHSFYQRWNDGMLSIDELRQYAINYYAHVRAFPLFIRIILSDCDNIEFRNLLLANLMEEEGRGEYDVSHPELWLRFAEGVGCSREHLQNPSYRAASGKDLLKGYFEIVDKGFAYGLGALYAYERQTPSVAASKIEGLRKFYDVKEEVLEFFKVHIKADEWHTEECEKIIEVLSEKEREMVRQGALEGASLLWKFLDNAA